MNVKRIKKRKYRINHFLTLLELIDLEFMIFVPNS